MDPLGMHAYHQAQLDQLYDDMRRDEMAGEGIFATPSARPAYPPAQQPPAPRSSKGDRDREELLDDQEDAADFLWGELTRTQRDALLTLSLGDGRVLNELLDALWREHDDEVEDDRRRGRAGSRPPRR